jgi:hypothetical protein
MKKLFFCLIFGSFIFTCCSKASALTFNWSTTSTGGADGYGTFDIAETSLADGSLYELTGIAGAFDGNTITGLLPAGSLWWGSNNKFQYSASSTDWLLNNGGIVFSVSGPGSYTGVELWSTAGNGNSSIYGTADAVDYYPGTSAYTITSATAAPTAVPGPLPLLGLGAAAAFSRKLKQRIALRRKRQEVGEAA